MFRKSNFPILRFFEEHKILLLLISLLLLVFSPPFIDEDVLWMKNYSNSILILIVIASYFIVHKNSILRFTSYFTFVFIILSIFLNGEALVFLSQLGISILILGAFFYVLKEAMSSKGESKNLLLASVTGYVIIGIIGGFLCAGLNIVNPDSFVHSGGMELKLYQLIYFSFVSVTTLGYGDITPMTEKAQALSLLLALSGQLFLTIIMAINIAKFIKGNARKNS